MARDLSKVQSENKLTSAKKKPLPSIGMYLMETISMMEDNARKYRPYTLEDIVHFPIFNSRAKTKQALTSGKTEEKLFPNYLKLFGDIYESYCQNLLDRINRDAVYKLFFISCYWKVRDYIENSISKYS